MNLQVGHVVLMWRTVVSSNKYYKLSGDDFHHPKVICEKNILIFIV